MPTLPELANYDAGRTIEFGQAGQKQRTLAELGRLASTGDYRGAEAAAFAGGETELALHMKQMNDEDKQRLVGQAASWAYTADDPQKWEQGRQQWASQGYDIGPFQSRQALLSQALTIQDRMTQANSDRSYGLQQRQEDRLSQAATADAGGGMFSGKSIDAQALNYLIQTGKLTQDQAAQMAAGKTITGPNGEILFMTPENVFGGNAGGGPVGGDNTGGGPIPITQPRLNADQSGAALYADRMAAADALIQKGGNVGTNLGDRVAGSVPVVGNYMVSDQYRGVEQAERDFINATLRRESGAAISPSEFDNARKQYFPQPGDDDKTIAQKARNRAIAIQGITRAAGPAYKPNGAANDPLGIR